MYQSYFGLAEAPFSIAPDPRYLYMSQRHQEALAHLLYGVNSGGGFVLLTGEVGSGKTTICRCLLEQIPASCDVAYIFNPKLTVAELLSTICVEFGINCPPGNTSIKVFVDHINTYLLEAHAQGRHTVLIIDEAQNLSTEVLEQMRLLTNLETNQRKLLQIILLGQPELATMLERPELRQLAQRIVARYHLGPLTKAEVAAYVRHRLEISGSQRMLFPAALLGRLYRLSGGIPRVINVLCDRALLGTYVQGREHVNHATLTQAVREVFYQQAAQRHSMLRPLLGVLILVLVAVPAVMVTRQHPGETGMEMPQPHIAKKATALQPINAAKPLAMLRDTLVWPDDEPRSRSREIANAALFKTWGLDSRDGDVCRQAESRGLRCQMTRGGLDELRQFNRPAVLQMRDDNGQEFYAALTGLDDKAATFSIAGKTSTVAIGALAAQWSGYYTLLWRMPSDAPRGLRAGERGPAVQWLSKQLARVQGRVEETGSDPVFDGVMVQQVKQFQLAQGLVPDGTLGPRTLLRLSSIADQTAPRLIHAQGGE